MLFVVFDYELKNQKSVTPSKSSKGAFRLHTRTNFSFFTLHFSLFPGPFGDIPIIIIRNFRRIAKETVRKQPCFSGHF